MEIYNGKFLVPQASTCYRLNPEEAELIKPILDRYGRKSKPLDEIKERFKASGGKKVRVTFDVTVPCYLEIESVLKTYRAKPENNLTNIIKRHKYLTYSIKQEVEDICNGLGIKLLKIKSIEDKEIVIAEGSMGKIELEVMAFIDIYKMLKGKVQDANI